MNPVFFNFDEAAVGTLPSGLVNQPQGTGGASGNWLVQTAGAVSAPGALGSANGSLSGLLLYEGQAAIANASIQFDQIVQLDGSDQGACVNVAIRSSGSGGTEQEYVLATDFANGTLGLYRFGSGGFIGQVGTSQSTGLTWTNGQAARTRVDCNGSTFNVYQWVAGGSQPGSPSATFTDGNITAPGYFGVEGGYAGAATATTPAFDNLFVGPLGSTFTIPSMSASPASVTLSSTGNSITLTGTGTLWTTLTPTISASVGAITGQSINSATSITLTYTAPASGSSVVFTDPSYGPISCAVTLGAPSDTLSISPTNLNASKLQYPVQLTPSNYSYGGTAPTVTLTGGTGASCSYCSTTGLAIICPGTASGTITVSDGTASTTLTVNSSTAVSIAPNNSSIAYYGCFNIQSTDVETINSGGNIEFGWQGADTCKFGLDLTGLAYPPELVIELDGIVLSRWTSAQIVADPTYTLTPTYNSTTSPASYAHQVKVVIAGINEGAANDGELTPINQWTLQQAACKILGLELPSGGSLLSTPVDPNQIEFLGDSITASVRTLYTGSNALNQTIMASHIAWPQIVADRLGLKPVVRGFGGTGITTGGSGSVPELSQWFPYVYSGVTYTPANQPAVVVMYLGTNDNGGVTQAQWQAVFTQVRTARPNALIFAVLPNNQSSNDSNLSAAVTAQADANLFFLNYSSGVYGSEDVATDGAHPNPGGHAKLGSRLASDIQAQLTASGVKLQAAAGGTYPTAAQVLSGVGFGPTDNLTGTVVLPTAAQVISTATFGASSDITGTVLLPTVAEVKAGVTYGPGSDLTGTLPNGTYPTAAQVLSGVGFGPTDNLTGSVVLPTPAQVISTATFGASSGTAGTVVLPAVGQVEAGITYGPGSDLTGTLPNGTYPTSAQVLSGVMFGPTDGLTGTVVLPSAGQVESGIAFGPGSGTTGTYVGSGVYPAPTTVLVGTTYGPTSNETGTVVLPTVAQVEIGVTFGPGSDLTGTYTVSGVYPPPASVLAGTTFGPTSNQTGTVVLPTVGQVQFGASFGPGSSLTGTYVGSVIGSGSAATIEQITELLASGVILASNGLDQVEVESGINARQALSPILAAAAGVVSGANTGNVVLLGGNSSTTRITATTDTYGNRSTVTLSLPS